MKTNLEKRDAVEAIKKFDFIKELRNIYTPFYNYFIIIKTI